MIDQIIGDYNSFLTSGLNELKSLGIDIGDYKIDHICFRVSTGEEYDAMKQKLSGFSTEYSENIHNGRPIIKFILKDPIIFQNHEIKVVELPAPKDSKSYKSGLEHFEIVVGENFEKFVEKYKDKFDEVKSESVYNKVALIRLSNKSVRFHQRSLYDVLVLQGNNFVKI